MERADSLNWVFVSVGCLQLSRHVCPIGFSELLSIECLKYVSPHVGVKDVMLGLFAQVRLLGLGSDRTI